MTDTNNINDNILRSEDIVPPYDSKSKFKTNDDTKLPGYDLAEAIMADHRKFSAAKRISPNRRNRNKTTAELRPGPISYAIEQSLKELSAQQNEIHEIVARDIQKLLDKRHQV